MVGYFVLMRMEEGGHDDCYYFGLDIHVEALTMVHYVEE